METRPIFDPYLFGPHTNLPPNVQLPPNITHNGLLPQEFSPKDFYENQYFYYRYLNEYLDYNLKRIEFEKKLNTSPQKQNGT